MSAVSKSTVEPKETGNYSEVPEGWVVSRIGDVLSINYGKALKESDRRGGETDVYGSNGFVGKHDVPLTDGPTVIIGRKGTVGAVHFSPSACWPIDTTYYIDNFWGMDSSYLLNYLRKLNLVELDTSTAIPGLNRDDIYDQDLLLAPIVEQSRIASRIHELRASANKSLERLTTAALKLKNFRQAVLAAACAGKLTEDWRRLPGSLQPANELLREIVERRRTIITADGARKYREPWAPKDLEEEFPNTWVSASVDQLTSLVTSGSRGWARYYTDSGPLFIRAENINRDFLDMQNVAHVHPPKGAEGMRTRVRTSDLLITITGANVTKSALVDREIGEAYVSQHIGLVRPVEILTAPYLYLWIISPIHGRQKLVEDAYGAGKPGLNLDNIREMSVALPPLNEQKEIAHRVEALFKLSDVIEGRVAAATSRAEKLARAVLAKAFRGELVPTEAELARREGRDYEPASVLLDRIKKERANNANANGSSRRSERKQRGSRTSS